MKYEQANKNLYTRNSVFLELFWSIRKIKNYQIQASKEFIIRTLLKSLSSFDL